MQILSKREQKRINHESKQRKQQQFKYEANMNTDTESTETQ